MFVFNGMIIFRSIKETLVFLGIHSPQSFEHFQRFNLRNSMVLLYFLVSTTLMAMFLFFGDGTLAEYSSAIYGTLCSALLIFLIFTLIWKTEKLYRLIDKFGDLIQKRKYSYWSKEAAKSSNYYALKKGFWGTMFLFTLRS